MTRLMIGLAACLGLAACGGTAPFGGTTSDVDDETSAIPETIAGSVQSVTYDPSNQTLTVVGVPFDDGPTTGVYRRRPGLDRPGYQAFTAQDGSLDRHTTAYVQNINGTQAGLVVTGVQFEEYYGGVVYSRGSFSAPVPPDATQNGGLVSYAGNYIGLLNGPGSSEDLIDVTPGTSPSATSAQAAEVTGQVLITGDFAQNQVDGVVYNRRVLDYDSNGLVSPNDANPLAVDDLALDGTAIETDGTFAGTVSVGNQVRGDYAGAFGGTGATEVAGGLFAQEHIAEFQNEDEYGMFVLSQCGTPSSDPVCNQPVP